MFWPMVDSSIIHDNISSLIHKKCHPKSYQSDIKYHVTLNIIFSVLCVCEGGGKGAHSQIANSKKLKCMVDK